MAFHIIEGTTEAAFLYGDGHCFTCGRDLAAEVVALKPAYAVDQDDDDIDCLFLGPVCPSCASAGSALRAVMASYADGIESDTRHHGHAAYLHDVVAATSTWTPDVESN